MSLANSAVHPLLAVAKLWWGGVLQPDSSSATKEGNLTHLAERLEAEEDADWWSLVASAAASISTSLRERGTLSALRKRLSSSRPFRLSERPSRTSDREL